MVLLYHNREDNLTAVAPANLSDEDKITSLEKTIQSRDKIIASLTKEITALKEKAEMEDSKTA